MAHFRQTEQREPEIAAQVAWVQRVKHLTRDQTVSGFDLERFKSALPSLLMLANKEQDVAQVPALFQSLGVHFVIVPHLLHTYLDGAALLFNDHPVVALTLRYNRMDSFWFTLLHEVAHIYAGHPNKMYLDNLDERDQDGDEIEANQMASDWLIDPDLLSSFVRATEPYFSRAKILAFARRTNRHPGVVLGRLQHDDLVPYRNLRTLLVKVQPYLEAWIDNPGPQATTGSAETI
jgi:HTH-type transcriptional regulator/antitoxin HigA